MKAPVRAPGLKQLPQLLSQFAAPVLYASHVPGTGEGDGDGGDGVGVGVGVGEGVGVGVGAGVGDGFCVVVVALQRSSQL